MMTKKMALKVESLKSEGWKLEKIGEHKMNAKYYKYAVLCRGDEKKTINHQGGEGGLNVKI